MKLVKRLFNEMVNQVGNEMIARYSILEVMK